MLFLARTPLELSLPVFSLSEAPVKLGLLMEESKWTLHASFTIVFLAFQGHSARAMVGQSWIQTLPLRSITTPGLSTAPGEETTDLAGKLGEITFI